MSIKTHLSNGEWKPCRATKGNCPFADDEGHRVFASEAERKEENTRLAEKEGREIGGILPNIVSKFKEQEDKIEEVLTERQNEYNSLNDEYSESLSNLEDSHGFDYNGAAVDLADEANKLRKEGKVLEYRRGLIDIPEIDEGDYELNPDTSSINTEAYNQACEDADRVEDWARELVYQVNHDVKQIQEVDWTQHGFDSQEAGVDEAIESLSDYYDY